MRSDGPLKENVPLTSPTFLCCALPGLRSLFAIILNLYSEHEQRVLNCSLVKLGLGQNSDSITATGFDAENSKVFFVSLNSR